MSSTTQTGVTSRPPATDAVTTKLLAAGALAGPLFVVLVAIQAVARPGFDLRQQPLSLLTLGDLGWVQVSTFVVSGLLMLAFAWGMWRAVHPGRAGTWGPILLGVYGAGLIMAGLFTPDPSMGFPPGAPSGSPPVMSGHSILHGVGFALAMSSLTVACFVFARRYAASSQWGWVVYCLLTAIAAVILAAWPSVDGASVRYAAAAVIVFAWTTVTALSLRARLTDRR